MNTQFPITSNQALGFLPAAVAGVTYMASRATAAVIGFSAKKASSAANAVGQEKIGQFLNTAGEKCISFATRSPKTEIAVVGALTLLGASAVGVSELLPQDNLSVLEYGKRMIGMTKTLSPWEYLGEHPSILGFASSAFMGISLFASREAAPKTEQANWSSVEWDCSEEEMSQGDFENFFETPDLSEGQFLGFLADGVPHGKGTIQTDNKMFQGEFDQGKFKAGKITTKEGIELVLNAEIGENKGTYTGFINDDNQPHGDGTLTFKGTIYKGTFENFKFTKGIKNFSDGTKAALNKTVGHSGKTGTYSGQLNEKNQPHGEGILVTSDGTILKGEFKNGAFQGKV